MTGKIAFGVSDTLQCLEMGAVEPLIVWENLEARAPAAGSPGRAPTAVAKQS